MVSMKRLCCLLAGVAVWSECVYAQNMVQQGLDELFRSADEHNTSIGSQRTAIERARLNVEAAKSQRLPDLTTSLSVNYIGTGQLLNRNLSYYANPDFPHWGNAFMLEAQQVVYSGGALSSGIRLAELGKEMSELEEQSLRQDVHMLLAGLYLQRHSLQNRLKVVEHNISLADTLISKTNDRFRQGVVLKNDVTRYELMREQMNLARVTIEDNITIVDKQLQTAVNSGEENCYRLLPQEAFSSYAEGGALDAIPAENVWQSEALSGSSSLQKTLTAIEMSRQQEKMTRAASLPKVALVAADNLQGPNTINVPALDKNVNYWYVGVGVSYDISSLYKNNKKIRSAAAGTKFSQEQRQVAKEGLSDAVHAAYMGLQTSKSELLTRRKSVELARQNYYVIAERYNNGLALVTDMTDAANVRLDAELQLVDAQISVVMAMCRLKYVCGHL